MRIYAVASLGLLVVACSTPAPPIVAEKPVPPVIAPTKSAPAAPAKSAAAAPPKSAPAKAPPVAAKAAPPAPSPLDLKTLEERLKDTHAIGVMTKLALKNQVDDLIGKFKAFHAGTRPPTLAELRPAYDLLLMKVMTLLQDGDTALAHDIHASRDAIWGVLTDRGKFAKYL